MGVRVHRKGDDYDVCMDVLVEDMDDNVAYLQFNIQRKVIIINSQKHIIQLSSELIEDILELVKRVPETFENVNPPTLDKEEKWLSLLSCKEQQAADPAFRIPELGINGRSILAFSKSKAS